MIFTIIGYSAEIKATEDYARPPSPLKTIWQKFWQFSNTYGEYHSLPPSRRRQFLIEREQCKQSQKDMSESSL